jgi:membrane protease YdiL (CAAX protease family)
MTPGTDQPKLDNLSIVLRVGLYAFLVVMGMILIPWFIAFTGQLIAATLSTFAAGAIANAVVLRIYEEGKLAHIGLAWNSASPRNLSVGLAGGAASAILVTVLPVILRLADFTSSPPGFSFGSVMFVTIILLFGAVGEEMMFRGYAFQLLVGRFGAWAMILPFAILFAAPHLLNPNQTLLGALNTALWGVMLGYAWLRSGDLWLPIGLHAAWNISLALLGANLSGFTMSVTGIAMRWNVPDVIGGGAYGPEGGLLTTLVLIPLAYALHKAPVRAQAPFLGRANS